MKLGLFLLALVSAAAAQTVVDPRGARPVVPNTRSEKCAAQKDWPFCTDEEWGPKCPSGCRIHGLLEKFDHDFSKRIEKIRGLVNQNQAKHRTADQVTKQTHDYLREKLTIDTGLDSNYFDMAQTLRQRISEMKIKIDQQLLVLGALKERVRDQVQDMKKLEVDIDMKLRSCKGSCKTYHNYEVDHDGHVALEKQMNQVDTLSGQTVQSVGSLHVMKSRPLKDAVVDSIFKSSDPQTAQQTTTEDLFPEVKTVQLFLEIEGSSSSPATISKVPGTSLSTDSSPSGSGSSHSGSGSTLTSITELGGDFSDPFGFGGGFEALGQPSVHTKSVSCTKRVRTVVVDSGDGPVQRMEEYVEGGPECQALAKGGTKTLELTAKGSLSDSKTSFSVDPFGGGTGLDLGAFMTDNSDDDVPDFHARSSKSVRVERRADYVGKDCVAAQRFHLRGESSGVFKIRPSPSVATVTVYCQQEGLMGGWLLAQQRESDAVSFNRSWSEYRQGFGSVSASGEGDFWLGNELLHILTNQGETMLRVELHDWEGGVASAEYTVSVASEAEGYALSVSGYSGDAGDALASGNGSKFSAYDRHYDNQNCAALYGAGWWYDRCHGNVNGVYQKLANQANRAAADTSGVVWATYRPPHYSLKRVRVFIRPAAF